ncbi:hypothetical protein PSDVSF_28060 [Pseudodesulfovibrio sediminis]|uniref:Pentapeptide repeat-containing protein n=1 Tax=Pseudodesulfovibrio sediminis TaxID=2810563 RepID=A0ABN6EWK8_9BACT|nr:hypothetical protein PSDVSF_28060 [Pseudodesulfovibrio sediminis]
MGQTSFENTHFSGAAQFEVCDFRGDVVFRSMKKDKDATVGFCEDAFFAGSRFWGAVEFSNLVMNDVSFARTQFNKEAIFSSLSLKDVSFLYVDLSRNVRFYNVVWEERHGRYYLKDELESGVLETEHERLDAVKKQYGELVSYYDDVRDSESGEKFFISEMQVKAKKAKFYEKPVFALYNITSKFGTSWLRAASLLLFLIFIFSPTVVCFSSEVDGYLSALVKTIQLLLLHKNAYVELKSDAIFFVYVLLQLAMLSQVALFSLAIRRRFRRGGVPS